MTNVQLSESDKTQPKLAGYSSLGGGKIFLKIKNMKKRINTGSDVKDVEIGELEIVGDPSALEHILGTLL